MRKSKVLFIVGLGVLAWGLSGAAQATLIDRGSGMIYDSDQNLTWLQDANYAMTSGYATTTNGQMAWWAAMTWADTLVYGGYSDWRLPTALNPDGSDPCSGFNCIGSEMGHLYYTELGNDGGSLSTSFTDGLTGLTKSFSNLQPGFYWSGTVHILYIGHYDEAWYFQFNNGDQTYYPMFNSFYALAVRDGDSAAAPVPEPATVALLGIGLAGMAGYGVRRRRQRR